MGCVGLKTVYVQSCLCLWLLLGGEGKMLPKATPPRPNIILIVADDMGYNDVSFHGSDQIPTPNIDYLGYNGIILNNYYVSPLCTPTRSALMTGKHPIHTGMQHSVIVGDQPYGLPLNETIMPQHLNALGYRSHMVGKWHLGMFKWEYTPVYRGFESHFGFYQGRNDYYNHTDEVNLDQWGLDFRRDKQLLRNYTNQYSTFVFRDEAVRIINEHNKSEPLFLYLPFQTPHSGNVDGASLQAPQEYIDRFSYIQNKDRRTYAAMMSVMDDAIGVIYDTLITNSMLDNSIIIFTSDNGGATNGIDHNAASNFPLRGVKATIWEGGVRSVGLIHSPLLKTQSYVSEQMFHVTDWLPTLYTAAGGDATTLKNLDGFDSWAMLNLNSSAVRTEILHNIDPIDNGSAIRVGDYKLILGNGLQLGCAEWYPPYQLNGDEYFLHYSNFSSQLHEPEDRLAQRQILQEQYRSFWPPEVVSRIEELRLSHGGKFGDPVTVECGPMPANASTNCDKHSTPCLFHIPSDPCEYHNIAQQNPDLVKQILSRLEYYASTMIPPANLPYDDTGNPKYHQGAWEPWL